MSMLSAQCDELRAMAESVGLEMPQATTLMMEAADTIWELRESVHRERSEADRLRELVRYIMHQCNDGNPRCDECIGWNDGECVALLRMRELGVNA